MKKDRLYYQQLAYKLFIGTITDAEREELEYWFSEGNKEAAVIFSETMQNEKQYSDLLLQKIYKKAGIKAITQKKAKFGLMLQAAASVIVIVSLSLAYYSTHLSLKDNGVASHPRALDVAAPQINSAYLTLQDGSKLYLSHNNNGEVITQNKIKVVKLNDGRIKYESPQSAATNKAAAVYNLLTNPKGSNVINITLADGTGVWLNAGSSVRYPIVFSEKTRMVELNGEAYFEVAKDPFHPFIVKSKNTETTVLGTHFNVSAYQNEKGVKVTLLEGRVKVSDKNAENDKEHILSPGQQAFLNDNGKITTTIPDIDQVIAWQKGEFYFKEEDIKSVMRQIARWYNLEIVFKDDVEGTLSASISRNVGVAKVLHMIELTGKIRFELKENKIIVTLQKEK